MHQIDGPSSSIQPISASACHTPLHTESSTDRAHITGYMIQKRSSSRKSNRPSTAPSGDDWPLLPSLHTAPAISLKPLADVNPSFTSEETGTDVSRKMQTVLEDDSDISLTFGTFATLIPLTITQFLQILLIFRRVATPSWHPTHQINPSQAIQNLTVIGPLSSPLMLLVGGILRKLRILQRGVNKFCQSLYATHTSYL